MWLGSVVVLIYSVFIRSILATQCYSCDQSLFNLGSCKRPKTVSCYSTQGCYVAYNILGQVSKAGCNDRYYLDSFWYPKCFDTSCLATDVKACTCWDDLCNNSTLITQVKNTPKIVCASCKNKQDCDRDIDTMDPVDCDVSKGCGHWYETFTGNTTFRGCGGGVPQGDQGFSALCFQEDSGLTVCSCGEDACNTEPGTIFTPCDEDWTYDNVTNKCYLISHINVNNYAAALSYCINYDASNQPTLASIHSQYENDLIKSVLVPAMNLNNQTDGLYIGLLLTPGTTDTYFWQDQSPVNYTNWAISLLANGGSSYKNITQYILLPQEEAGVWEAIPDTNTNSKRALCQVAPLEFQE